MALLEIKNIYKSFGENDVLKGVNIKVNKGDVVSVLGPSGSGKTTLLRCINFLEKADKGEFVFDGKSYDFSFNSKRMVPDVQADA